MIMFFFFCRVGGVFVYLGRPCKIPELLALGRLIFFSWVVGVERINASVRIDGQLLLYMYGYYV